MRAFTVLLALVATPFLAGVSQSSQGLKCDNGRGDEHRSAQGTANAHKGVCKPQDPPSPPPVLDADQDGVPDGLDSCPNTALGTTVDASGCPLPSTPPPPLPPPPTSGGCVGSQLSTGSSTIRGRVELGRSPWDLQEGWCVELRDAASDAVLATRASTKDPLDGMNNYVFTNVPAGSYEICEVKPADPTWANASQAYPTSGPACSFGFGFMVTVTPAGGDYSFYWFGNTP